MEIKTVAMKDYSSLYVGGEGSLVVVKTTAQLVEAMMYAKSEGLRVHVIGEGTNTFFGDDLKSFLFIKMAIKGISLEEQEDIVLLKASAGENWDDIVMLCVEKNYWGIENLSYIPGTVGGAPIQNIGAYGSELADVFVSLQAVDIQTLDLVSIDYTACEFKYRDSLFKHQEGRYIITSVTLKVSKAIQPRLTYTPLDSLLLKPSISIQEVRDLVVKTRNEKLPDYISYPNAGSFFKNPVVNGAQAEGLRLLYPDMPCIPHGNDIKIPAAWLIEHVGEAKGLREGDVGTWPSQPLVLVNYGHASSKDVLTFSNNLVQKIREKTGVQLECEVNFVK